MAELCPTALVVEHLARGRIAVAGGQPDVPPAHLPELSGTRLEQRPLELLERLVAGEVEMEIKRTGLVVHGPIVIADRGASRRLLATRPGTLRA